MVSARDDVHRATAACGRLLLHGHVPIRLTLPSICEPPSEPWLLAYVGARTTSGTQPAPNQHDAPERTGTGASGSQHQVSTSASALDLPRTVRASDLHVCAGWRRVIRGALPFGEHLAPHQALQRERQSGLRHRRGLLPVLPRSALARSAQGSGGPRGRLRGWGGRGGRDRRLYPGAALVAQGGRHDFHHVCPFPDPCQDGRAPR